MPPLEVFARRLYLGLMPVSRQHYLRIQRAKLFEPKPFQAVLEMHRVSNFSITMKSGGFDFPPSQGRNILSHLLRPHDQSCLAYRRLRIV
jgi:hypothetical protein